jgi:hypothetical protein
LTKAECTAQKKEIKRSIEIQNRVSKGRAWGGGKGGYTQADTHLVVLLFTSSGACKWRAISSEVTSHI